MENKILSSVQIKKILEKLSDQVIKEMGDNIVVIGIKRRGAILAKRIKAILDKKTSHSIDSGSLDITLYRDDFSAIGSHPVVSGSELMFDIDDRKILLVDDVLYTGRTVRAAIECLIDFGRPQSIKLAVLIDRGHRELPIQPDIVGKSFITRQNEEIISVKLEEIDNFDSVFLIDK